MLIRHFGVEKIATILEYEPAEVQGKANRRVSPSLDEARLLNPLVREVMTELNAERAMIEADTILKRDFLVAEAMHHPADERALWILITHVVDELELVSGHSISLQWYAMLDGRTWWKAVVDGVRIDGDQFRIPHSTGWKIGDALREGIEVILDKVGMDMTTLRYSSDVVHQIIDDLGREHLTFAIEAYRELKEGKVPPVPEGLQPWVEADPEFVWAMPED